jgi:deazaflavin-dependent oxidoreductase (nitroreductase family)
MSEPRTTPQTRYIKWVPRPGLMKRMGHWHATAYRLTGGLLGGRMDGLDMLLLTTTGRKSGKARTVPLPYFRDGTRHVLVASYGGNPRNPAWLDNIVANGEVTVQIGFRRTRARAVVAGHDERERIWSDITSLYPRFLVYQEKTFRRIPIVLIDGGDPLLLEESDLQSSKLS